MLNNPGEDYFGKLEKYPLKSTLQRIIDTWSDVVSLAPRRLY